MKKLYNIRLEETLKEKLEKKAKKNLTSVAHEVRQAIIKHLK